MRIAVYINADMDVKIGGGFSFISRMIEKLRHVNTKHKLIFIKEYNEEVSAPKEEVKDYFGDNELHFFDIEYYKPSLTKVLPVPGGAKAKLDDVLNKRLEFNRSNEFKDYMNILNVDLVYYPAPMVCINPEVPFFTTLWDLGHLTLNSFPEVHQDYVFEIREAWYTKHLNRAAGVLVESEAGRKQLHKFYSVLDERVHTIPLFPGKVIEESVTADEKVDILNNFGIEEEKYLFYPAQYWAHKNHINLLRALKSLKESGHNLKLVFTGSDHGNQAHVKSFIEKNGLESSVLMLGFLSFKEIRALYESALALTMPTFLGPSNMPPIESALMGTPVICSEIEGHREVLGDTALYFNPKNYNEIAERVVDLLSIEDRKAFGERTKSMAQSSGFNLENGVSKLLESFDTFENERICWD
jgi:glycosyltransferase involved in cell wall biosynthesis